MANISDKLTKILSAIFGKDVRQALHDGLEAINNETIETTKKQTQLDNQFHSLIINAGSSNAENVSARTRANGTTFDTIGKRMDDDDARLDKKIYYFNTVEDMKNSTLLNQGDLCLTLGYYAIGDNGGCYYNIISAKSKSYDIACGTHFARPMIYDTVCPKQFGTKNDGVNGDNVGLQACFDYANDYNISEIDGKNLLYTTDSTTDTMHDHKGVLIHGGITLKNYRGQIKTDVSDLTSVLDLMLDDKPYNFDNCHFDGKYGVVPQSVISREDGGRHLILFYHKDIFFPTDFLPCGDITIKNSTFLKPDSYGIALVPSDCTLNVDNCKFDTNGLGILTGAVKSNITNCTSKITTSYKTMVLNFCHDEMEFAENYKGSKTKSVNIDNCHLTGGVDIFKIEVRPQRGLKYSNISISNCSSTDSILEIYEAVDSNKFNVDNIDIHNCIGNITFRGVNCSNVNISKIKTKSRFTLRHSISENVIFKESEFNFATSIILEYGHIKNLTVSDSIVSDKLSGYFKFISVDDNDFVENLNIENTRVYTGEFRIIEGKIKNTYINGLHMIQGDHADYDFMYNHQPGEKNYIVSNCVMEVPTRAYCNIVGNKEASTGTLLLKDIAFKTKMDVYENGMTVKKINVVDITA